MPKGVYLRKQSMKDKISNLRRKDIQEGNNRLPTTWEDIKNRNIKVFGDKLKYVYENEQEIINLYIKELLPTTEIGKRYNVGHNVIKNILIRNNILLRPQRYYLMGEKNCNSKKFNMNEIKEIIKQYVELKPHKEICSKFNISSSYLNKLIKKNKINIRNKIASEETKIKQSKIRIERGLSKLEKNPAWLGGKSFEPYTQEFNKEFKYLVRFRDNFACLNCGISEQKHIILTNKKLHIHHIDYEKKNTCLQNCCTLCNKCNILANKNRQEWKNYYQEKLSKLYYYKYQEQCLKN